MLLFLVMVATILSGLFGGMALQKLIVELPARKKIGSVIFAKYAKAADLGNGIYVYPAFAVVGLLVTIGAFVIAFQSQVSSGMITLLSLACGCGVGVLVMTFFAAPQMLGIRKVEESEEVLTAHFDKFVLYSWPRAVFIWLQFILLLWTLFIM